MPTLGIPVGLMPWLLNWPSIVSIKRTRTLVRVQPNLALDTSIAQLTNGEEQM